MRELLLFVLVVAVMVVTSALAAISGVSVSSSVSREPNDTDRAARPDAPEGQRRSAGDRLASGDERPAPCESDAQRGGDDAEGAALFGARAGDRQATAVANALQRERLQAQLMPVQEMVNRISNAFQKLFVEDTPDIIPMDAERNLKKKKRDLGMDAETDLFQIGVFDDRDVPLGNKDSLSFINALERFRRKPSIIEVPVYPPKLIYVRSNPYKQIDHRDNVNLYTSDDTNKEETYSSVSSNETEWVNDTSKDEDTNSALMDISKEGDTVPPEEYVNKSFVESLPQEIPDEDWETARQDLLKGSLGSDVKGQLPHLNNLIGLKFLIITNNPMTDLTPDDLSNTTHIRILHLLKNKFHKIPTGIAQLEDLTELVFESISQNFVFRSEILSRLKSLTILHLSGTNIKHWPGKFRNHPFLEELCLNRCNLKNFSTEFSNFPELRVLNVRDNLLTSLSSNAFKGVNKLTTVDLSRNLLTSLPNNAFKGLGKLTTIDLSQNFLQELPPKIFIRDNPQPRIMFVNLSNNRIALFSEVTCASLSALKEVDIGSNVIDCSDCKAATLQHWLDVTKTTVKNVGRDAPLRCSQPPALKGSLVQLMDYETCYNPGRFLWLGIGAPVAGVVVLFVVGGLCFYYRTEVLYFAHLAKVRATSKNKDKETERKACYDAFVCYSGKNRKWVLRRLVPLLERRPENYSLCLFDRDFRLGTHIVTNIIDAIDHSRKVIVVLTQHFIDSKWCQWELEMAQHKLFSEDREFLVLLELEPLERRRLPRLLRFLLDTRPVVRWPRPETAPAVMAAAAELRAVLGPSLRQNLLADPPTGDEPRPSSSSEDKLVLVANESGVANDAND